ncbi:hypothetical protein BCR34DRAFT_595112 [Clohesyomyces aquaticus]|uniref:Uncharacterized protein n=1 Tax=Clohesyomyces aquaticus TaxID=1231657 RepID=A0A1Y1XVQ9_9PLEO|nr:hypothetical protein BCR34DRAFT_595112 [Clohesyomyces aquaticus]
MLGPNALRPLDLGLLAAVGAASPLGSLRLDIEETGLVRDRVRDGISLEFPILLDNNAALESDSIANTLSISSLRDDLDVDLDVASMRSFFIENVGGVYNKQDEFNSVTT